MGRHRRADTHLVEPVSRYEILLQALHTHRPGERSGLCLSCGTAWPCRQVWLPLQGRLRTAQRQALSAVAHR
jgi:hypothetical protein